MSALCNGRRVPGACLLLSHTLFFSHFPNGASSPLSRRRPRHHARGLLLLATQARLRSAPGLARAVRDASAARARARRRAGGCVSEHLKCLATASQEGATCLRQRDRSRDGRRRSGHAATHVARSSAHDAVYHHDYYRGGRAAATRNTKSCWSFCCIFSPL